MHSEFTSTKTPRPAHGRSAMCPFGHSDGDERRALNGAAESSDKIIDRARPVAERRVDRAISGEIEVPARSCLRRVLRNCGAELKYPCRGWHGDNGAGTWRRWCAQQRAALLDHLVGASE